MRLGLSAYGMKNGTGGFQVSRQAAFSAEDRVAMRTEDGVGSVVFPHVFGVIFLAVLEALVTGTEAHVLRLIIKLLF